MNDVMGVAALMWALDQPDRKVWRRAGSLRRSVPDLPRWPMYTRLDETTAVTYAIRAYFGAPTQTIGV